VLLHKTTVVNKCWNCRNSRNLSSSRSYRWL